MTFSLRALTAADLSAVVRLENTSQPLPWTEAQLSEELAHDDAIVRGAVVEGADEALVGYAAWRRSVDELWLLNLAVLPSHRRQGLGRLLLDEGAALARERSCASLWLEVRAGNVGARALYEAAGFASVGVRRGYYRPLDDVGAREDAVLMSRAVS